MYPFLLNTLKTKFSSEYSPPFSNPQVLYFFNLSLHFLSISLASSAVTSDAASKPGLWENIRKKKDREGKKYKPAKPGDPDRPDPEQWKKLTKKD